MPAKPRLPSLDRLLPPLDGRPLSSREVAEIRALRIAVTMAITVIHGWDLIGRHRPIPDGHEMEWLRDHLLPLEKTSVTIKRLRLVLNDQLHSRAWYSPASARNNLRRLGISAHRLGRLPPPEVSTPPVRARRWRHGE